MLDDDRIELVDWIIAIRGQLTEAALAQREREQHAAESNKKLPVPPLRVRELRLELELSTEKISSKKGAAKGAIKFWVLPSIELSGEAEARQSRGTTQKVVLTLEPIEELTLGDGGPELLRTPAQPLRSRPHRR